jgi:hypothetical protein
MACRVSTESVSSDERYGCQLSALFVSGRERASSRSTSGEVWEVRLSLGRRIITRRRAAETCPRSALIAHHTRSKMCGRLLARFVAQSRVGVRAHVEARRDVKGFVGFFSWPGVMRGWEAFRDALM